MRHPLTNRHFEVEAWELLREYGPETAQERAQMAQRVDSGAWGYWDKVGQELRVLAGMRAQLSVSQPLTTDQR